jgi:threonyl-tRNA synthetase
MIFHAHPSRAARHARTLHRLPRRVPQGGTSNFPLWLAPDQVRVITIGDDEALVNYSKQIVSELRAHEVRADGDYGSEPMKAKIAEAEKLRVHTMLVIGGRDMEAGAVSVRLHGKGNIGAKLKAEAVADISWQLKNDGRKLLPFPITTDLI